MRFYFYANAEGQYQYRVELNFDLHVYLPGIFDHVEHVFVVGCGGAVPDYHDYEKHVRLGDIVVATAQRPDGPVYIHCENLNRKGESQDNYDYQAKNWFVKDPTLPVCTNRCWESLLGSSV